MCCGGHVSCLVIWCAGWLALIFRMFNNWDGVRLFGLLFGVALGPVLGYCGLVFLHSRVCDFGFCWSV